MAIHRYSRWDGTQERELSPQDMIDQLSEQILEGDDLRGALRRMMERGGKLPNGERGMGMRDMLERLRQRRERNLEQYNLNNMMGDIQARLDEIIGTERQGIDKRLGDLDPPGVGSEDGDGQHGQGSDHEQGRLVEAGPRRRARTGRRVQIGPTNCANVGQRPPRRPRSQALNRSRRDDAS